MQRAIVEIRVGGGHSPQSVPENFQFWLEEKLIKAGLPYKFTANLSRACKGSGASRQGDLRATGISGQAVVVVGQCGKNDTCRELYLMSSEVEPQEVMERINALRGEEPPLKENGDASGGEEPLVAPWFPTDEESLQLYLVEMEPLLRQPKGCLHGDAIQAVRRVTPKVGRDKSKTYDQILKYLVDQELLDFAESGAGKGWRRYYRLTKNGEAAIAPSAVAPAPPAAPPNKKATPSLLEKARQVAEKKLREAAEIEALAAAIEPAKPIIDRLRVAKREAKDLEKNLAAKRSEIEELEASLTPEILADYNRLKDLIREPTVDSNGTNDNSAGA